MRVRSYSGKMSTCHARLPSVTTPAVTLRAWKGSGDGVGGVGGTGRVQQSSETRGGIKDAAVRTRGERNQGVTLDPDTRLLEASGVPFATSITYSMPVL